MTAAVPRQLAVVFTASCNATQSSLPRSDVFGVRPLVQLDVSAPGIVDERKRAARLRVLRVRPIQLDAGCLELLCKRFEIPDVETDVIQHAPFGSDGALRAAGKRQVHARQVCRLELPARAWLGAEEL